jgi:hypothetical protein
VGGDVINLAARLAGVDPNQRVVAAIELCRQLGIAIPRLAQNQPNPITEWLVLTRSMTVMLQISSNVTNDCRVHRVAHLLAVGFLRLEQSADANDEAVPNQASQGLDFSPEPLLTVHCG